MRQRIAPFRRAQFALQDRLAKSYEEHDAIVKAILNGDEQTAGNVMRTHVKVVRLASSRYVNGLERAVSHTLHDPSASTQAESSMARGL